MGVDSLLRGPKELTIVKTFNQLSLVSPAVLTMVEPRTNDNKLKPEKVAGLTPIMEDLRELVLSSQRKKAKDDFEVV